MPLRICILINVFVTAFSSSGRTESLPSPTPISEIIRLGKPNLSPSHHPACTYASHQSISLSTYLPTPQCHITLPCPPHLASPPSLTISHSGGRTAWSRVGVRAAGVRSLWPGDLESGSEKGISDPKQDRHGGLRDTSFLPDTLRVPPSWPARRGAPEAV